MSIGPVTTVNAVQVASGAGVLPVRTLSTTDVPAGVAPLPPAEREWLTSLGVRLIVPIAGTRDRLVGVLLLGERKSEEPYSAADRRVLQGIAAQIGLV